jgi:Acetyltransferases
MIEIREALKTDIERIVAVHNTAFKDFFLTSLGNRFLALYYRSVLNNPRGILLVSVNEDGIIGFCAGTLLSAGFNSSLVKSNFSAYAIETAKLIFTNPVSLWHLFKNFSKEDSNVGDKGEYAELLSIGVDPNVQRSGAGKAMLLALEEEVKKRGGKQLSLTTDFYENEKAIGFYHSLGYKKWYDFVTYPNRRMYRLIKGIQN